MNILLISFILLCLCDCEKRMSKMQNLTKVQKRNEMKIVGGGEINIERVPYYVQMKYKNRPREFLCGASLLTHYIVITAGQCVRKPDKCSKKLLIIAGSDKILSGDTYELKACIRHREFSYEGKRPINDLALIGLEKPVEYSTKINPVFLPDLGRDEVSEGTQILVVGLGLTKFNGSVPKYLLAISLPVVNKQICEEYIKSITGHNFPGQLCIGNLSVEGEATCTGDYGGPAVDTNDNSLIGIVSWGGGCGRRGHPGVYTNVRQHGLWILDTMGKLKRLYPMR